MTVESLESRKLMSASLSNGVLSVVGTNNPDVIDLSLNGNSTAIIVKRNNVSEGTFPLNQITSIKVLAQGGNDKVTLAGAITKPATLEGGAGNDELTAGNGNDTLKGGDGNDVLNGRLGNDDCWGGNGGDVVTYQFRTKDVYIDLGQFGGQLDLNEADTLHDDIENAFGGAGNDVINGSPSNNHLKGFGGNDTIFGEAGNDLLDGMDGDDKLIDFWGKTVISGGNGNDTVDYSQHAGGVQVSLDGVANDGEYTEQDNVKADVENIIGTNYDDTLYGNASANRIWGMGGNDAIVGNGGFDRLYGGNGNDYLFARDGVASEIVDGGAGTDKADVDWNYYPYGKTPKDVVSSIENYY